MPVQNACIESFNGRLRDDCLNKHWSLSVSAAYQNDECPRSGGRDIRHCSIRGRLYYAPRWQAL